MEDQKVKAIYEASFSYNDVRMRVDILARLGSHKWDLIEVKSSTRIKNEYLPDVGVQYHVLKGAGLDIDRVILLHLNNQYVYDGREIDLERLFISSDMTQEALGYQEELQERLQELKDMLRRPHPPVIAPSRHSMNFQEYFVHQHCGPKVTGFKFENVEQAAPAPGVLTAINQADRWYSVPPIPG